MVVDSIIIILLFTLPPLLSFPPFIFLEGGAGVRVRVRVRVRMRVRKRVKGKAQKVKVPYQLS